MRTELANCLPSATLVLRQISKDFDHQQAPLPESQISQNAVLTSVSSVITRPIHEDTGAEILLTYLSLNPKRPSSQSYLPYVIIIDIR